MRAVFRGAVDFLQRYRWLLVAACGFVLWKWYLVATMWRGRTLPPEPDDSLFYVGHIYSVLRCPTVFCDYADISLSRASGYAYLTFRLLWGLVGKVIELSPMALFELNFYVGMILLAGVLVYLVTQLTPHRSLQVLSLLFFGLFFGGGVYHGFFWVVPSFYALLLALLLVALILDHRRSGPLTLGIVGLLALGLVFMHPTGLYYLLLLPLFWLILFWWDQRVRGAGRKVAVALLVAGISYAGLAHAVVRVAVIESLGLSNPANQVVVQLSNSVNQAAVRLGLGVAALSQEPSGGSVLSSWEVFLTDYLAYLFPAWPAVFLFAWFLVQLMLGRSYRLLALFVTSLIGTLIALLHPHGYRSLLLLWPVTYLLYAFGVWHTWQWFATVRRPFVQRIGRLAVIGFVVLFAVVNIIYSIAFAQTLGRNDNVAIPVEAVLYLVTHASLNEPIFPGTKLMQAYFTTTELIVHPQADRYGRSKYLVDFVDSSGINEEHLLLDTFFLTISALLAGSWPTLPPGSISEEVVAPVPTLGARPGWMLERQFGDVYIWRNVAYGS